MQQVKVKVVLETGGLDKICVKGILNSTDMKHGKEALIHFQTMLYDM